MKNHITYACMFLAMGLPALLGSCGNPNNTDPTTPAVPTDLRSGESTDSSVVLSWSGATAAYEVAVNDAKAVPPATTPIHVTGKTYTATGLTAETEYTWKVRAIDGDKASAWVDGEPFTTAKTVKLMADDIVGSWTVSGYFVTKPEIYIDNRTLTITKIDEHTVRIADMLGLAKYFIHTPAEDDVFEATLGDNTISIASQTFKASFDYHGDPIQLCRFMHDNSEIESPNWKLGFDNIPISTVGTASGQSCMTIDLGAGGYKYDTTNGVYKFQSVGLKDVYGTFIPLTTDPTGADKKIYGYKLWWCNTVWTRNNN